MSDDSENSQYRLLILGDGSVRTITLSGSRWVIGRATDCNIPLRDRTVSRRHLLLERDGDTFSFQDLGGANPAQLEGRPVRSGKLILGQPLSLGLSQLVLEKRRRPEPITTNNSGTVVLSRQIIDDEDEAASQREAEDTFSTTAAKVLQRIEWTFADLGDLADAAQPMLELALNLTGRRTGWIARFEQPGSLPGGNVEPLAAISANGSQVTPELPAGAIAEARQIGKPHVLTTQEGDHQCDRLLVPLGKEAAGLIVLEDPAPDAPHGQELLHLAQSLGSVVWHRLQETMERRNLRDELERLRFHGTPAHNALLTSTRLQTAREQLRAVASNEQAVLLLGERGTERVDLARYLHAESPRRGQPFWSWRSNASTGARDTEELFGTDLHPGVLQRAAGGTLLVEDPTQLDPAQQKRLAQTIHELRDTDHSVRLVLAATPDQDPTRDELAKAWGPELQQVISFALVRIPALRTDTRDVLALAELFLSELGTCTDGSPRLMTERSKRALTEYRWPGNVRELRLTIESAAARAGSHPIAPRHLPPNIADGDTNESSLPTLEAMERAHIESVMQHAGGVRHRAAQILGIAKSTLYEKLKKYQIEV